MLCGRVGIVVRWMEWRIMDGNRFSDDRSGLFWEREIVV